MIIAKLNIYNVVSWKYVIFIAQPFFQFVGHCDVFCLDTKGTFNGNVKGCA